MEKNLLAVKSFLVLLVFVASPKLLWAATNTSTMKTPERTYYTSGKKNMDLEFVLLSEQMKDRHSYENSGTYNKIDTSFLFSPNKNEDLRLFFATVYEQNKGEENVQYFELAEFMYRMKSLLTEKDNGVKMDLELKSYYVTENDLRDRWGFGGAFIPQLVFKKKVTSWLSLSAKVRQHLNMRKNAKSYTVKEQTRIYLSPTFVFSRNFMFNTEFTWKHKNRVSATSIPGSRFRPSINIPKKSDVVEIRPSLMYLFTHTLLAEVYADTKLAKSHDGRIINKNLSDELVYGLGMYWTAF